MPALREYSHDEDVDISEAEAALEALSAEYPGYARADVVRIEQALALIQPNADDCGEAIETVFGIAHDIKGQGASFGYDLMTQLGDTLCDLTREQIAMTPEELSRARMLIAACGTVLDERLTGDGGERGRELLQPLGLIPTLA